MIRVATISDKLGLLDLIREFADTKAKEAMAKFDVTKVSDIVNKCIEAGTVLVMDIEDPERLNCYKLVGGMAGLLFNSLMSYELIYQDLFFYIQPSYLGYTKSMLNKLEERCKELKVDRISMATMGDNPRLDKLYELLGYSILEKHFSKEII